MKEGEIQRWATVRQNLAKGPRELPDTVKRWMGLVREWRPEVVITDFEPLAGTLRSRHPHAAGLRRQHQHARPLPARRARSSGASARTS